jgi:hypothetical protein
MGIKSNNLAAIYHDFFSRSGTDAVSPEPGPATYISASGGDTITTDGDYKVHIFTTPGPHNFSVSQLGSGSGPNNIDYLVIGGGGGGGSHVGGGGGAGGFVCNHSSMPASNARVVKQPTPSGGLPATTNYAINIGAGGAGISSPGQPSTDRGSQGTPSTLNGLAGGNITALGGAGGGAGFAEGGGGNVGSGGGAGHGNNGSLPGPQLSTAISPQTQGYEGGTTYNPHQRGGGGGGAGGFGNYGGPGGTGNGGPGITLTITGGPATFAGGGGGGAYTGGGSAGNGGPGGGGGGSKQSGGPGGTGGPGYNPGGNGTQGAGAAGANGGANTGGGGGGSAHPTGTGGTGGPGIVIIRYKFQ